MADAARLTFFGDEEAKLRGRTINVTATELWWYYHPGVAGHVVLAGTIVIVGGISDTGPSLTLPTDVEALYHRLLRRPFFPL